ncbi:MAG: hypothetical protein QM703_19470 [Gemmatales bacterium]
MNLTAKQKELLKRLVEFDKRFDSPTFHNTKFIGLRVENHKELLIKSHEFDEKDYEQIARLDYINAHQEQSTWLIKVNQSGIDLVDGDFGEVEKKYLQEQIKKNKRSRLLLLLFTPIGIIVMFLLGFYLSVNGILFSKNTGRYTLGQKDLDNIVLMQKKMMEFYEELQRLKGHVKPEDKAAYDLLNRITETQEQAKHYMEKQTETNEKLIEIAQKKDSVSWLGYLWIAIVFIVGVFFKPFIDIVQEYIKPKMKAKMESLKPLLIKKAEATDDHDVH